MHRATLLAGLVALLIGATLLAACRTTGDAPAGAQPAQPTTAGARVGGGPIAGSPTRKTSPAAVPLTAAPPAPTPATAPDSARTAIATAPEQLPAPAAAALPPGPPVPHIYMALQSGGASQAVSAVFAIDAARDNTPSNDPAVRLTPEAGLCNPQEMRSYDFAAADAARPVVSEAEQAQGLTARDLPAFMAVSVTDRMLSLGLASEREQTRALNVCTRKLWERLLAGNPPGSLEQ